MSLESTFFNTTTRREITCETYQPLKSAGEERRKKLLFRDELGEGHSMLGMPGWVGKAYESVANNDTHADRCNMDPVLKGMTVELYATEEGEYRALLLTGCTIKGFHVVRIGQEEKARFYLYYTVYAPDSKALHDWLFDYHQMSSFARFDVDQSSLSLDADVEAVTTGGIMVDEAGDDLEEDEIGEEEEDYDALRREATDPKHDAEFAAAARTMPLVSIKGGRRARGNA